MKKKFLLLILMICGLCFSINVFAEEESVEGNSEEVITQEALCSLEKKNELRTLAANVTINYQPVEVADGTSGIDDEGNAIDVLSYYFDVKIYNINSQLKVIVKSADDENTNEILLTYKNMGSDGAVTARKKVGVELSNLVFEIYGSDETGGCSIEKLRTIKLTLPKYNNLAEREICADIPEFYMCQKYISYDIKPESFSEEVKKYKEKKEKQESDSEAEVEDNNTVTDKAADLINKNKYIIVGAIVVAGAIITIIIIRRKKSVL